MIIRIFINVTFIDIISPEIFFYELFLGHKQNRKVPIIDFIMKNSAIFVEYIIFIARNIK